MKNNKVSFFLPSFGAGGAERALINIFKGLNKDSYTLSLVLVEKKGDFIRELPSGLDIISFETRSIIRIFFKLRSFFLSEKPDIFISVFPRLSVLAVLAKILSKSDTKVVIIEHSVFSSTAANARTFFRRIIAKFVFPILMRVLYGHAQQVICVSGGVANDISKITGISRNKIEVIHNPIIGSEIRSLAQDNVSFSWISERREPIILAVGRLVKAKDYPTLLRAFSLIIREIPAKLIIIGEGEEKIELEKFVIKLNIADSVAFLGFQSNPYKYMAKSSVFVLSSIQEGFPTVIAEAMASGVPVVSTNCKSGPSEIIKDGENGLLVPVGDSKTLSKAILKLLNNLDLGRTISENGKKTSENFSINIIVRQYEEIINKLLKK